MSLQDVIGPMWDSFERQTITASKAKKKSQSASATAAATEGNDDAVKAYDEKIASLWLKDIFASRGWNGHIPIIQEKLQSYFIKTSVQPDMWLGATPKNYPLLLAEILSKCDLDLTVEECERGLIDQLRLYRNYDTACKELHGFVLPASVKVFETMTDKACKKESKRKCPILKVTVKWHEETLGFRSKLKHIHSCLELQKEMEKCATENWKQWACHFESLSYSRFFLPVIVKRY